MRPRVFRSCRKARASTNDGLLIETHMLKPYKSRVRGTYDILRYTLEEVNQNKNSLFEANRKADAETVERGKIYDANRQFALRIETSDKSVPFAFKGVEFVLKPTVIRFSNDMAANFTSLKR